MTATPLDDVLDDWAPPTEHDAAGLVDPPQRVNGHRRGQQAPPDAGALDPVRGDSIVAAGRVDWSTFWQRDRSTEEWLAAPVLARARGHALIAPAKLGKSILIQIGLGSLATGRGFLERPAGPPVLAGYIDYEMTDDDLYERLDAAGFGPDDDLSRLHYIFNCGIPPLDTPAGGSEIVRYAVEHKLEFLVIDSFARAVEGPEDSSDTVRAFYRNTGAPLKAAGIGWIRLDNTGHSDKDRARGSSGKTDDVDIEWVATRTEDGIRLRRRASRVSWVPERVDLCMTAEPLGYRLTPRGWVAGTKEAAELLDRLAVPVAISVREAGQLVRAAGEKASSAALADAVRWRKERDR